MTDKIRAVQTVDTINQEVRTYIGVPTDLSDEPDCEVLSDVLVLDGYDRPMTEHKLLEICVVNDPTSYMQRSLLHGEDLVIACQEYLEHFSQHAYEMQREAQDALDAADAFVARLAAIEEVMVAEAETVAA